MRSRVVVALLIGAVGLVFLGQGLGLIPGSYMTGDRTWAVIGALMIVIAFVVGWRARRQG